MKPTRREAENKELIQATERMWQRRGYQGAVTLECPAVDCTDAFSSLGRLQRHVRRVHGNMALEAAPEPILAEEVVPAAQPPRFFDLAPVEEAAPNPAVRVASIVGEDARLHLTFLLHAAWLVLQNDLVPFDIVLSANRDHWKYHPTTAHEIADLTASE